MDGAGSGPPPGWRRLKTMLVLAVHWEERL